MESLWASLGRTWMRALGETTALREWRPSHTHDAAPDAQLWVVPKGAYETAHATTFEALELLALIGQLSFPLWSACVRAAWPRVGPTWVRVANGRALPLCVDFERSTCERARALLVLDDWLDRMFLSGVESATPPSSPTYTVMRAALEQRLGSTTLGAEARDQLTIRVRLDAGLSIIDSELRLYLRVATQQRLRDLNPAVSGECHYSQYKPLFHLSEVATSIKSLAWPKTFLYYTQIAGCGINLDEVSLLDAEVNDTNAALYISGLQTLLAASLRLIDSPHQGSVASLKIPATMTRRTASAIFSALATSQSVRSVQVNVEPDLLEAGDPNVPVNDQERTFAWKWIALCVFSHHATNRLEHVRLHVGKLAACHVAAICDVLDHTNPTGYVLNADESSSTGREQMRMVAASRFMLPSTLAGAGTSELVLPLQDVRVIDDRQESELLSVLLPGCGLAFVRRQDVSVPKLSASDHSSTPRHLSSLRIFRVTDSSKAHILTLLNRVGRHIKCLDVVSKMREPTDLWLRSVFQVCPELEDFSLVGVVVPLSSLETISECYERGMCRTKRLCLTVRVDDTENAYQFFTKLLDPRHPMTQSLRKLDIAFDHLAHPLPHAQSVLTAVLTSNRVLNDFSLSCQFRSHDEEDVLYAVQDLNYLDPLPIAVRHLPLELSKKLAFLSATICSGPAVPSRGEGRSIQLLLKCGADNLEAHQLLDRGLVTQIFQFAAECRARQVFVYVGNRPPDGDQEDNDDGPVVGPDRRTSRWL